MSALLSSAYVVSLLIVSASSALAQSTYTVAAASDLANVQSELQAAFCKNKPACIVRFVNGASGLLTQQIRNGAPYDVFLSANAQYADQLASEGKLVPGSLRAYASGRVGILWQDGKRHPFSDLRASWVRVVALPNPTLAPYGVAARQALEHEKLWAAVQSKIVYGENVRQALQLFESKNADAVLTSASLLLGKNPEGLPPEWHQPVIQKAGIVSGSSFRNTVARSFLEFLVSPAGQAVFANHGYGPPPRP